MIYLEPDGLTHQSARCLRDDFVGHLCAGGSAQTAVSEMRALHRRTFCTRHTRARFVVTLAMTAWETGRLYPGLKDETVDILTDLPAPDHVAQSQWQEQVVSLSQRLHAPQPHPSPLSRRAPWRVWDQLEYADPRGTQARLIATDPHWVAGAFHSLAVSLTHPGVLFVLPHDPRAPMMSRLTRSNTRATWTDRKTARRALRDVHARLVLPQDVPRVLQTGALTG